MSLFKDFSFAGKKALVRVDFNVPLNEQFQITDDTRMRATVKTINKILQDGGSVILMSHLGRPKEGPTEKYSLKHVVAHLSELLGGKEVQFADDCIGADAVNKAAALQAGQVLLLENLRFYKEEEKGDAAFAEKLAKLGDVYVNDAFGTAHRAHASTAIIAQYFSKENRTFGYLMEAEVVSARVERAYLATTLQRIGPDHAYLERGCDLMRDESQGCVRHIGAMSRHKLMGERMSGAAADTWWRDWETSDPARLVALGARVLEAVPRDAPKNRRPQAAKYLTPNSDRYLLTAANPYRWGLLRALAEHLGELARSVSDAPNQEEYVRRMGRCWAW